MVSFFKSVENLVRGQKFSHFRSTSFFTDKVVEDETIKKILVRKNNPQEFPPPKAPKFRFLTQANPGEGLGFQKN